MQFKDQRQLRIRVRVERHIVDISRRPCIQPLVSLHPSILFLPYTPGTQDRRMGQQGSAVSMVDRSPCFRYGREALGELSSGRPPR
jgi:hypothetical protein